MLTTDLDAVSPEEERSRREIDEAAHGLRLAPVLPGNGVVLMTPNDEWSPDEQLGTEAFEQGDEATDDATRIDPHVVEDIEQDPSVNPTLQVDDRELEEAGAEFDDPERMVTLEGGMDDPDGLEAATTRVGGRSEAEDGWGLDAPLAGEPESEIDLDE
jgi:hypothetical protein